MRLEHNPEFFVGYVFRRRKCCRYLSRMMSIIVNYGYLTDLSFILKSSVGPGVIAESFFYIRRRDLQMLTDSYRRKSV